MDPSGSLGPTGRLLSSLLICSSTDLAPDECCLGARAIKLVSGPLANEQADGSGHWLLLLLLAPVSWMQIVSGQRLFVSCAARKLVSPK